MPFSNWQGWESVSCSFQESRCLSSPNLVLRPGEFVEIWWSLQKNIKGVSSNISEERQYQHYRWTCQLEWGQTKPKGKFSSFLSLYEDCHQNVTRLKMNLPVSDNLEKKNPSEECLAACVLVDSRSSKNDNHDQPSLSLV